MEYFARRNWEDEPRGLYRFERLLVETWLVDDSWHEIAIAPHTLCDRETYDPVDAEDIEAVQRRMTAWHMSHGTHRVLEDYYVFVDLTGSEPRGLYRVNGNHTVDTWNVDGRWVESSVTRAEIAGLGGASEYEIVRNLEDVPEVQRRVRADI
jgi:hypothetical protein